MSAEIKTIACQQCGSHDVMMLSETQGICNICGAKFVILQPKEELTSNSKSVLVKSRLKPEFTKEDFLRKLWIDYARYDAPFDVFWEDFKVTARECQIVYDSGTFAVDYTASVGYDRKEPYIDYETYSVQEPYTEWDGNRNVTRYRTVQKQRQVTKYKDVTDWNVTSGSLNIDSAVVGDNDEKTEQNEKEISNYYRYLVERGSNFISSIESAKKESLSTLTENEANSLKLSEYAKSIVKKRHDIDIESSLSAKIPGDHVKDIVYTIKDVYNHKTSIYIAPEYCAEIEFKGQNFICQTFPFGLMKISKNENIKNEEGIDEFKEKKETERNTKVEERQEAVKKLIWERTKLWSFISIGTMVLSWIISLTVRVAIIVFLVFAAAMAAFVYTNLQVKKITSEENDKAKKDIMDIEERIKSEIESYETNHKAELKEILNKKLKTLGLKPVSPDEL